MKHLVLSVALLLVLQNISAQSLQNGGGEYRIPKSKCITAEQHAIIEQQLKSSMIALQQKGILPQTFSPQVELFDFPLKQAPGYNYNSFYGISNYFDLNPAFPNQITDYNCGARSYDTNDGYNHQGIDYFLWPFDNLMMNREQVQIVAAQAGTILFKSNGNSDQNCAFCSGCNRNAVYIVHSDGSVACVVRAHEE
ncbi:MAG: hypothetical protein K2X48_04130 [Chitinophagaceae bacterium]|nr:hypothetical protein [Chitinophagaceae bacterium]